jgi:hypothetical protein
MATPKPGEIRCPTCHRSTPPAAFCTQCGSAIPPDARIRPRGMDRDELQERIRARRTGGDPFRRGGAVDDEQAGYERFEPDPQDAQARRGRTGASDRRRDFLQEPEEPAVAAPPPDLTRDRDEWVRPATAPTPAAAPPPTAAYAPPPSDVPVTDEPEPEYVDNFDDAAYEGEEYEYAYDDWEDSRERRSGGGALAIVGFLALGVVALLGGALLAGIFSGSPGTGQLTDTPSPSVSASVSAEPSESVAPSVSAGPSGSPSESGGPVVFPDGFSAEAQPCIPGSASGDGCDSNGAVNSGSVWIWVGFKNGTQADVIGVTLILPDGSTEDGSIDLAQIGCSPTCPGGWTYFPFSGLPAGTYQVEITRNGEPAGSTSFEVT